MAETEQQNDDAARLDEFQIEIQKVTDFVQDNNSEVLNQEEEKELTNDASVPFTPSMDSVDVSVSYSDISDDTPYVHGVALSSPLAQFHRTSAIPDVVEIHDLLTTRDQTLFFIADSDDESCDNHNHNNANQSDSDLLLSDKESSQPKTKKQTDEKLQIIDENNNKNKKMKSKMKMKKRKSKLQQTLSERGLTFAISEGHVYFNWTAFIREFNYNFFHVLALPIILYCENKSGAQSRYYWPCDWGLFGFVSFLQIVGFFYINILYFGVKINHGDGLEYALAILVFNVLYICRLCVIAIKWAYLPPQIFVMMRKKKLTQQQLSMIHLLSGWVGKQNKTGLAREIGQCCARLELDINKLSLSFRDERTQKLKSNNLCLRRRCSTYTTYGNLLIPYVVFCASRYVSKWASKYQTMALITSPIICSLPLIARIVQFNSFHNYIHSVTIYGIIWYLICFIFSTINLLTLIQFCAVIALDFKRRYQFVRFSTRLIELKKDAFKGFVNYTNYKQHLFPQYATTDEGRKQLNKSEIQTLDLSDAQTMYNWSLLRAFFLDFGLRFLRREEAVLGYFTLSILIIVAFYLTMLYLQITVPNYWETTFVVMSSFAVLTPAFVALRYATRINQKVAEQRSILADKRLRLENEKTTIDQMSDMSDMSDMNEQYGNVNGNGNESSVASLGRASLMLEKIMKMLEVDRFRIRLLGYPIDTTVTGIIAAVVGTIGFLVARLLLGSKVQGLPDT